MLLLKVINRLIKPFRYRVMPITNFRLAVEALIRSNRQIRFIQVGANDGVRFDDLFFIVTSNHWQGLVIEPLPTMYARLVSNYQDHKSIIPINIAIHPTKKKELVYYVKHDALMKYPDYAAGIASMVKSHLLNYSVDSDDISECFADCKSLTEVANEYSFFDVDVLQIDTEGFDCEILKSIDFSQLKPLVIKFEWMNLKDSDKDTAVQLLSAQGYSVHVEADGVDCVAVIDNKIF